MEKPQLDFIDRIFLLLKKHYKEAIKINETNAFWRAKIINYAFLYWKTERWRESKNLFDSLRTECYNIYKYQTERVDLGTKLILAIAYAGLGEKDKALNQISKLDSTEIVLTAVEVAYFMNFLVIMKRQSGYLRKPFQKQLGPLPGILKLHPRLDPIRNDPRFKKIIATAEERIRNNDK